MTRIDGWSRDYSATGVRFRCLRRIHAERALFQFENMGRRALEIEILRGEKVNRGMWEYGARFVGVTELPDSLVEPGSTNETSLVGS